MVFHPSSSTLRSVALRFPLSEDYEAVLTGRENAERARVAVERAIREQSPATPCALDFSGIEAISAPFVDEFLGKLLSGHLAGYYEDHPLLALNADPDVRETINVVLRARGLSMLYVSDSEVSLLGGERRLEETLQAAAGLGRFRASQLAEVLGLTPQAANNRLKTLLRQGALLRARVVREGGGKEFEYEVPRVPQVPAPPQSAPKAEATKKRAARRTPRRPVTA